MSKLISQKLRIERQKGEWAGRVEKLCCLLEGVTPYLANLHTCVYVSGKNKYNAGAGKMTQLVQTCLAT